MFRSTLNFKIVYFLKKFIYRFGRNKYYFKKSPFFTSFFYNVNKRQEIKVGFFEFVCVCEKLSRILNKNANYVPDVQSKFMGNCFVTRILKVLTRSTL